MRTCAFTGHRPQNLPWQFNETDSNCLKLKEILIAQINKLATNGVTDSACVQLCFHIAARQIETLCPLYPGCIYKRILIHRCLFSPDFQHRRLPGLMFWQSSAPCRYAAALNVSLL